MGIKLAKTAGFCFGVRNAIDLALKTAKSAEGSTVFTFGPLIHNREVIQDLEAKGIVAVDSLDAVPDGSLVVVRAHGVGKKVQETLEEKGCTVIDATCPFVKKIHRIVEKAGEMGNRVIILGDPRHPEVEGIRGWCREEAKVYLTEEDLLADPPDPDREYTVVAQTTSNPKVVEGILSKLSEMGIRCEVEKTICSATREHQEEAVALAKEADAMVVIGSPTSSNTRKLYQLCLKENPKTFFVETKDDLTKEMACFGDKALVGVTAGASTPDFVIQGVVEALEEGLKKGKV